MLKPALIVALVATVITQSSSSSSADLLTVVNHSFEDTSGQTVFNEFTFGTPTGWQIYDPFFVQGPGVFTGTLEPDGVEFFNSTAPDGTRVGILFNSQREGDGEYGFEQTLTDVLQAHTTYSLDVEVGNIASGFATNGTFFNLDEFPGYRVELLAGGVVIAEDLNGLSIPEGEFLNSTVSFTTGASHPQLGAALGIRLVNLNEIPAGFTQATSPDLEVDFDNVRLTATAIPEPAGTGLAVFMVGACIVRRRR